MSATLEKPPVQKKAIKVPQRLYREAEFKVEGEGDQQRLRMSISSDVPYLRYDWWNEEEYWEVLSHTPGDIDESRLKAGLPILFNHNRDDYLGRATTYMNDGHRITVEDIIWSQSETAQQKKADAISGALPYTSVGYSVDDDGEEIGEKDGIPIYKFKWTPFEGGPCTVPADISTGTNRTRDHKPEGEPKEISVKKKIDEQRETNEKRDNAGIETGKIMTPEEQAAADEKARKQREADEKREAQERAESVIEGVKAVREREKEIRAIAKRATNLPDADLDRALEDAIVNENAVEAFRKLVFEKYFGSPSPIDTPAGQGTADIRVIGERKGQSLGHQFVDSESFKRGIKERRTQGRGVASIDVPFSILGARGKAEMAQRAGFVSSDLAAVNIQVLPGIISLGVQRLTIMDLLAAGQTNAAALPYPRENTFGTVDGVAVAAGAMPRAKAVGERGIKPLWDPDLTTETANVRKIAVTTKVPDEFMADFPAARSFIDERLPFMVDTETEFQILYGDGVGNNLKGIFSIAGVQTRAITTTDDSTKAASLMQGLTDIRVGSFFEPDGYAFHPYDWETAKLLKDDDKRFLAGGPFYIPYTNGVFVEMNTFWGKPVVVSTAVTYGRPVAGCWKLGAQYFIREGMRIDMTNSNEDDFRRNLIMLLAEHRLALAVYRPVAFLEFTGFPARA